MCQDVVTNLNKFQEEEKSPEQVGGARPSWGNPVQPKKKTTNFANHDYIYSSALSWNLINTRFSVFCVP